MPHDDAFESALFERLDGLLETIDTHGDVLHLVLAALHQIKDQIDALRAQLEPRDDNPPKKQSTVH